jgi:pseudouridine synthase
MKSPESQTRKPVPPNLKKPQRINKILSAAGLASRRGADSLILSGRVSVNDEVLLKPGAIVQWGKDKVLVDGHEIPAPKGRVYLMLNKPFGYISALNDPQGRPVVTELLNDIEERVYPVGRLDFDTLGLLLLTNDGDWANQMMHPRYKIPRTYKVTLAGEIREPDLEKLRSGVDLDDGFSGPARVTLIKRGPDRSLLRMTIHMGRSRVVRRMMSAVGHDVIQLIRIGFGPLALGDLKVGSYRHLSESELMETKKGIGMR